MSSVIIIYLNEGGGAFPIYFCVSGIECPVEDSIDWCFRWADWRMPLAGITVTPAMVAGYLALMSAPR